MGQVAPPLRGVDMFHIRYMFCIPFIRYIPYISPIPVIRNMDCNPFIIYILAMPAYLTQPLTAPP